MRKNKYAEVALLNMLQECWDNLRYGHEIIVSASWVDAINKIAKREGWK